MVDTIIKPYKGVFKLMHPFYFGYALFIVCQFAYFNSGTVLVHSQVLTPVFSTYFTLSTLSARIVVYAIAAFLIRRMIEARPSRLALIAMVFMVLAVLLVVFAPSLVQQQGLDPLFIFITAGILLGFGDAMLLLLWGRLCGTLSFRTVYVYILMSYLIGLVCYSGIFLLQDFALTAVLVVPLVIVFIIATSITAKHSVDVNEPVESEYSKPVFTKTISQLWRPVFGTSIFCFISGLMSQISGLEDIALSTFQQVSIIASLAAVVILLVPALSFKNPLTVENAYRLALPISAAGFLLLPFIWNGIGGLSNALVNIGYLIADIILWCVVADVTRDTKLPAALTFGLSQLVLSAASILGISIGFFGATHISNLGVAITDIALTTIYLLSVASLFLFRGRMFGGKVEEDVDVAVVLHTDDWYKARCQELGEAAGFTHREFDVVSLVGRGRSVPSTSKALFVSENTVKSHLKSIYQKLDIHSKQELMDLIEAAPEQGVVV
jgi:DNA-binding CsgD family transcriptional regulator